MPCPISPPLFLARFHPCFFLLSLLHQNTLATLAAFLPETRPLHLTSLPTISVDLLFSPPHPPFSIFKTTGAEKGGRRGAHTYGTVFAVHLLFHLHGGCQETTPPPDESESVVGLDTHCFLFLSLPLPLSVQRSEKKRRGNACTHASMAGTLQASASAYTHTYTSMTEARRHHQRYVPQSGVLLLAQGADERRRRIHAGR
ncbi:hypothetical protein BC567DRAFT_217039 [Phyllosticta citribraziliensis]